MSATDQMRAMLDELMGTDRNGIKSDVSFTDPRVCKSFLLGCCPHDILSGTRMDIGECSRIHEFALKADYEKHKHRKGYNFELDALEHLESFIAESDWRTESAKRRLKDTQDELSEEANTCAERIHQLGEEIGTKLAKAEQLGAEGRVEESLKLMAEVDSLNTSKGKVEVEFRNAIPSSTHQQQKLRVCEVCSAYLGVHDNDRRLADHFGGKLHLGFISIRNKLDEMREYVKAAQLTPRPPSYPHGHSHPYPAGRMPRYGAQQPGGPGPLGMGTGPDAGYRRHSSRGRGGGYSDDSTEELRSRSRSKSGGSRHRHRHHHRHHKRRHASGEAGNSGNNKHRHQASAQGVVLVEGRPGTSSGRKHRHRDQQQQQQQSTDMPP